MRPFLPFLRRQQDVFVGRHRLVKSGDTLRAPHEERHYHVWKDNDVSQREERNYTGAFRFTVIKEHDSSRLSPTGTVGGRHYADSTAERRAGATRES